MWLEGFGDDNKDICKCIHFLSQIDFLLQCKNKASSSKSNIVIGVNQTKITNILQILDNENIA
jgi:hypothetical protein